MYIHNLSHQSKTWDSNSMLKCQKLPNLISKTSWESCVWPTAVVHSASGRAVPGSRTWRQQAARCRARAANPSRSSRSNRRILPATSRLEKEEQLEDVRKNWKIRLVVGLPISCRESGLYEMVRLGTRRLTSAASSSGVKLIAVTLYVLNTENVNSVNHLSDCSSCFRCEFNRTSFWAVRLERWGN